MNIQLLQQNPLMFIIDKRQVDTMTYLLYRGHWLTVYDDLNHSAINTPNLASICRSMLLIYVHVGSVPISY